MEKLFIKIIFAVSILILLWILLIVYKKIFYLLKSNKEEICYKIIQPDTKNIIYYFILVLILFSINIMVYRLIFYHLSYDVYGVYWEILLIIGIPIFIFYLLLICNEFFPTIVTTEYICWSCQKVYQKNTVKYYYDSKKIVLYCDSNKLVIKRKPKYDSIIEILEAYYEKNGEMLDK